MDSNKRKSRQSSSPKKSTRLPKHIRNELRMTCAMRGFSKLKTGSKKHLKDQRDTMFKFYHGRPPNHPSQIKLLSEGRLAYSELYDEVLIPSTNKNESSEPVKRLRLKHILTRDDTRNYYSGTDIRANDLEKKNLTGNILIGARNIHDLAIKGAREYKKALSFNNGVWDNVKMQPKDSGDSIDDCIEYVRREMYKLHMKPKDNEDESDLDSESHDVLDNDEDSSVHDGIPPTIDNNSEVPNADNPTTSNATDVNVAEVEIHNDNQVSINPSSSEESIDVPRDYLFPSFFVFVLWGPYVEPDKRLKMNLIEDNKKSKSNDSRKDSRKNDLEDKKDAARSDTNATRGFSTDQRIEISNLNERRQERLDRLRETSMVSLSIENSAITTSLTNAERRAEARCKEYDPNNVFWKKVDLLIEQQEEVVKKMALLNSTPKASNAYSPITLNSDETTGSNDVELISHGMASTSSDIILDQSVSVLNEESSPKKRTKKRVSKRAKRN